MDTTRIKSQLHNKHLPNQVDKLNDGKHGKLVPTKKF